MVSINICIYIAVSVAWQHVEHFRCPIFGMDLKTDQLKILGLQVEPRAFKRSQLCRGPSPPSFPYNLPLQQMPLVRNRTAPTSPRLQRIGRFVASNRGIKTRPNTPESPTLRCRPNRILRRNPSAIFTLSTVRPIRNLNAHANGN
jgi:hypothetical protein